MYKIANATWHWDFKYTDKSVVISVIHYVLPAILSRGSRPLTSMAWYPSISSILPIYFQWGYSSVASGHFWLVELLRRFNLRHYPTPHPKTPPPYIVKLWEEVQNFKNYRLIRHKFRGSFLSYFNVEGKHLTVLKVFSHAE